MPIDRSDDDRTGATAPAVRGTRIYAVRLLIGLLLVALAFAVVRLADLLLLAFAAILIAILLRAISGPLAGAIRLGQGWSLAVTVVVLAVATTGLTLAFGASIVGQMRTLVAHLPTAWRSFELRLQGDGVSPALLDWTIRRLADAGNVGLVTQIAGGAVNAAGGLLLALVGGTYLAAQPDLYRGGLLLLIPPKIAELAAGTLDAMHHDLRHWLVGQLATMALVGSLTGTGAFAIGIPSAGALGLVAAVLEFVPYVGPIATAIPALLLAFSIGESAVLLTLGLLVTVQQLEGYLLTPLIQRRAVSLPPAITLFAVFAMGILLGPLGVLLAAPLTVCAFVLVRHLYLPLLGRAAP